MARVVEFLIGLLFGLGLLLSGMSDPGKVLGFLDVTGRWDPSLALVMGGAVLIGMVGFALARRRSATLLGAPLYFPEPDYVNRRLIWGALVFGTGWGLAGFCPGPAIVSLGAGSTKAGVFVLAMVAGMYGFHRLERMLRRS